MATKDVDLFGTWRCRAYQDNLWRALNNGCKRAVSVWHRRAGKDDIALRWAALSMIRRQATYWHLLPLKDQARTAIWSAINPHTGIRRIDESFPEALFEKRETDMMIRYRYGTSTWQVKGSDNYGAGIGSPPAGIVFSEYSRANPDAWAYLRPILRENDGWAMFISTPFGHNHFERMYRYALANPNEWYADLLTYKDTGVMTELAISQELRELTAERGSAQEAQAIVDQEYSCSFDSAIPGAIYGPLLTEMERAQPPRITTLPHDPNFQVKVCSDLGASVGNDMALWWYQEVGREIRFIDCDSEVGVGIDWFADKMAQRARDRRFVYAPIPVVLPHDAAHPQAANEGGRSFADKLKLNYGYANVVNTVTPDLAWSINQVKAFMRTCVIDAEHCARGLDALRGYHRRWDADKRCYSPKPVHDWTSNFADAFRTAAEAKQTPMTRVANGGQRYAPDVDSRRPRRTPGVAVDYADPLARD